MGNGNLLHLTYTGKARIVERHDYAGLTGGVKLLVFQLRSLDNRPGGFRVWRLLDVPKITMCSVSDETFPGSRVESRQRHHAWDILYARVGLEKTEHRSRA